MVQILEHASPGALIAFVISLSLLSVIVIGAACWIIKSSERTGNVIAIIKALAPCFRAMNVRSKRQNDPPTSHVA